MGKNNIHRHCPEVENLMEGKMPLVTRCGITFVVLVLLLLVIVTSLFFFGGAPQQLMKEIIEHTIEQIKLKI